MNERCLICGHDDLCDTCPWCHHLSPEMDLCCEGMCVTTEEELCTLSRESLISRILGAHLVRGREAVVDPPTRIPGCQLGKALAEARQWAKHYRDRCLFEGDPDDTYYLPWESEEPQPERPDPTPNVLLPSDLED